MLLAKLFKWQFKRFASSSSGNIFLWSSWDKAGRREREMFPRISQSYYVCFPWNWWTNFPHVYVSLLNQVGCVVALLLVLMPWCLTESRRLMLRPTSSSSQGGGNCELDKCWFYFLCGVSILCFQVLCRFVQHGIREVSENDVIPGNYWKLLPKNF